MTIPINSKATIQNNQHKKTSKEAIKIENTDNTDKIKKLTIALKKSTGSTARAIKMLEEVDQDGDGYWAYAREGYIFKGMGCRTAHEYTQKELLEMIRTLITEEEYYKTLNF